MTGHSDAESRPMRSTRRRMVWTLVSAMALLGSLVWVDLTPRVEADFFFAADDPQLRTTTEISAAFPSSGLVLVRAQGSDLTSDAYLTAVEDLATRLGQVSGVSGVRSVITERADRSPLWSRLLLTPDGSATNLVLSVREADSEQLVAALQEVLDASAGSELSLEMSGVPVIVELIRQSLFRDLVLFSTLAALVFGLLIALVYRRTWVVVGTLSACFLACGLTLAVNQALGLSIGLLTANIVTIVFVLTLSHIVFLTANARRFGATRAVRTTLPGSFWAMVTTFLGFMSLTLASARPLRELGLAGAMGAVVAILVAYAVYPAFLDGDGSAASELHPGEVPAHSNGSANEGPPEPASARSRGPWWLVAAIGAVVVLLGTGVPRVQTDPGLLTYFQPGSELRDGLESIDRDGGSSTLDIVVRDPSGRRLDTDEAADRMWAFQDSLEAMPAVGVTLSPPVLFGHARLQPFANLIPLSTLADLLESDALGGVGRSYLSADRLQGRFNARMHEVDRSQPRDEVIARIERAARGAGLEPVLVGGVFDLQRQLGQLIASSLRVGLGGLLALFLMIGLVVTRSARHAVLMLLCLTGIPLVVLGAFGHLGIPVDMITSPAANVALALGVDSMIHLAVRARILGDWRQARAQMTQPIVAGALIVCLGFGIFVFSSFPPTARFGLAVILGTVTAATMALLVLPTVAARRVTRRVVA